MSSLYLDHFGLSLPPFAITPDPDFFFAGGSLIIEELLYASLQREGIVLLTGEVGSGKTLLTRVLLSRLPDTVDTVYLPNPAFSRDEIIDVIGRDLGLTSTGRGLESLQHELIRRHTIGRQVIVLIDEAHTMPGDAIEEVRRLSNLETDRCKLVQIILCGQPELDALLATPSMRQVRDRVVYRFTLKKMTRSEASRYLNHRLRIAGWHEGPLFSAAGMQRLLNDANGRARRLNLIADKSLLAAYAEGKNQVSARHVGIAIGDVGTNFSSSLLMKHIWPAATALLLSATLLAWHFK